MGRIGRPPSRGSARTTYSPPHPTYFVPPIRGSSKPTPSPMGTSSSFVPLAFQVRPRPLEAELLALQAQLDSAQRQLSNTPPREPVNKALLVGINYSSLGENGRLSHAAANVDRFRKSLEKLGFPHDGIQVITDESGSEVPTFSTLMRSIEWLVGDARDDDLLLFAFSGHSVKNLGLLTADQKFISPEVLHHHLVMRVPAGCELQIVLDCSSAASLIHLQYCIGSMVPQPIPGDSSPELIAGQSPACESGLDCPMVSELPTSTTHFRPELSRSEPPPASAPLAPTAVDSDTSNHPEGVVAVPPNTDVDALDLFGEREGDFIQPAGKVMVWAGAGEDQQAFEASGGGVVSNAMCDALDACVSTMLTGQDVWRYLVDAIENQSIHHREHDVKENQSEGQDPEVQHAELWISQAKLLSSAGPVLDAPFLSIHRTNVKEKFRVTADTPLDQVLDYFKRASKLKDFTSELGEAQHPEPRASGGYAEVYRVTTQSNTVVAVKCIRATCVSGDGKMVKRTARELEVWSQLKHKNILGLLGLAMFKGCLAMVSTWMESGSVVQFVNERPKANRHKLSMQIVGAVMYLHSEEMVHGDIKGANILVSADGTPKLTDFGLTLIAESKLELSDTDASGGTSRWMAPELFVPGNCRSKATDIYALGMAVLEILTGKRPFDDIDDVRQVFGAVVIQKRIPQRPEYLTPSSSLNDAFWEALTKSWNHDPSQRVTARGIAEILVNSQERGGSAVGDPNFRPNPIPVPLAVQAQLNYARQRVPDLVPLRKPTKKALLVGINYQDLGKGRLWHAVRNASRFGHSLKNLGFQPDNIKLITDESGFEAPTYPILMQSISWLVSGAVDGDVLFFVFSGHCVGDRGLVTSDKRFISRHELHHHLVMQIPSGCELQIVLDCCGAAALIQLQYCIGRMEPQPILAPLEQTTNNTACDPKAGLPLAVEPPSPTAQPRSESPHIESQDVAPITPPMVDQETFAPAPSNPVVSHRRGGIIATPPAPSPPVVIKLALAVGDVAGQASECVSSWFGRGQAATPTRPSPPAVPTRVGTPVPARASASGESRRGRHIVVEGDRTPDHFEERQGYFVQPAGKVMVWAGAGEEQQAFEAYGGVKHGIVTNAVCSALDACATNKTTLTRRDIWRFLVGDIDKENAHRSERDAKKSLSDRPDPKLRVQHAQLWVSEVDGQPLSSAAPVLDQPMFKL